MTRHSWETLDALTWVVASSVTYLRAWHGYSYAPRMWTLISFGCLAAINLAFLVAALHER